MSPHQHRHPGHVSAVCNTDDQQQPCVVVEASEVCSMTLEELEGSSSGSGHSSTRSSTRSSKRSSKKRDRHVQGSSSGSGSSSSEGLNLTSRSFSCSACCSSPGNSSSCGPGTVVAPQVVCGHRPKSFTAGQQQVHRHRLAASTTAHISGSLETAHNDACCSLKRCSHPPHHHHHHNHAAAVATGSNKAGASRQRPQTSAVAAAAVAHKEGGGGLLAQHRRLLKAAYGPGHAAADGGQHSLLSSPGDAPELFMAESVNVQDIGKGFRSHLFCSRSLLVFDGHKAAADPAWLLRQVPQQAGLLLWLVKPPCSRQWVAVRLEGADNLQESVTRCLHEDGSCGPPGFKQRVLLDLMCRGFAVQLRWRPLKQACGSVRQDLLAKLRKFDFALCDADNNGCRPIELPDGRPVQSFPLVVAHMMQLFDRLFKPL